MLRLGEYVCKPHRLVRWLSRLTGFTHGLQEDAHEFLISMLSCRMMESP